jgi:hypothetical protein
MGSKKVTELEKYRLKNGLTFEALRTSLRVHGVRKSLRTVYRWCRGETYSDYREITPRDGRIIAEMIGVTMDKLYKS